MVSQSLNAWQEVLHITSSQGLTQCPRRRHLMLPAEHSAPRSNCHKNGPSTEVKSEVMNLVAFKVKANISVAVHHMSKAELALYNMDCPFEGLAYARQGSPSRKGGKTSTRDGTCQHWLPVSCSGCGFGRLSQRSPISRVDLPNKDTYCLRKEIPVASCLIHFVPFWKEYMQALGTGGNLS